MESRVMGLLLDTARQFHLNIQFNNSILFSSTDFFITTIFPAYYIKLVLDLRILYTFFSKCFLWILKVGEVYEFDSSSARL